MTMRRVFFFCALFLLLSLGAWQTQRLQWKEELLARISRQQEKPEAPLPGKIENPEDWEFRRVVLKGYFLPGKFFLLGPRVQNGKAGFERIEAFRHKNGVVFVNRGWTQDGKMKSPPERSLKGVVRVPEKGYFTPQNDPAKNDWYWADIAAMTSASGLKNVQPILVSLSPLPQIPNNHLAYALFWFGMAGALVVIYALSSRRGRRG